jgi:hypothetical protein
MTMFDLALLHFFAMDIVSLSGINAQRLPETLLIGMTVRPE